MLLPSSPGLMVLFKFSHTAWIACLSRDASRSRSFGDSTTYGGIWTNANAALVWSGGPHTEFINFVSDSIHFATESATQSGKWTVVEFCGQPPAGRYQYSKQPQMCTHTPRVKSPDDKGRLKIYFPTSKCALAPHEELHTILMRIDL